MKKYVLILLFLTGFSFLSFDSPTEEVKWLTFEQAVELNKKEPRKLLIDLYTDWCGWCKKMDKDTYAQGHIARYINQKYYAVKFNAEQRAPVQFNGHTFNFVASGSRGYHQLAASLTNNRLSYPTTVFMTEKLEIIQPVAGYMGPDQMEMVLKYFGDDHFRTTAWTDFQKSQTLSK
jgi:thioredoxin-related protein